VRGGVLMADQQGRVAVVTGAGRGLGQAIALGLAERGATVVAVARDEDQLRESERLGRDSGSQVETFACDVSDHHAVARLKTAVTGRLGAPTILVNAAGTFGPIALIRDLDPEAWQRTIMVDAVAALYTINAFVGGMLDEGWGRIVNITSAASLHPPGPLNSAYGTAKVALNQLTRHLAAEIAGTGVTANVIHPGDVKTAMWADIRDQVAGMGTAGENFAQWADWVEQTGGDPPQKAVALVLRLTSDTGAETNGEFCWIEDPLQEPIPSWDPPSDDRPWIKDRRDSTQPMPPGSRDSAAGRA
jgi:NAD(P)-dependent dehydrogenase (short-subunit alcohol dehydrogenase family)